MIKDQADSQVFDESVDEYDSIEVWDNSWANLRHSSIIMIFKTSLKFFILGNLENKTDILLKMSPVTGTF